ncbi:hypothetical protein L6232_21545, partial [Shewanella sp. C31]|nr:hypothetical protein [Shewanella electrica]
TRAVPLPTTPMAVRMVSGETMAAGRRRPPSRKRTARGGLRRSLVAEVGRDDGAAERDMLVKEQENVKRVQLAEQYLSEAALGDANSDAMKTGSFYGSAPSS